MTQGRRIPLTISLLYAGIGGLWILLSDAVLAGLVTDPAVFARIEIIKGWIFIGLTACLLYLLIRRSVARLEHSEASLRQSEERLRLLVERVTDYEIFMLDANGVVVSWNLGAEQNKGYTPEEVIGRSHALFFTPEDRQRGMPELELQVAADKGRFEDEGWRVRKDGSTFWANVVTTALYDNGSSLLGYAKVVRDVTARRQAELDLRESEERYRVIAETASDAIITVDEEGSIIFANPSVKKVFGYGPEEIQGRPLTMLMPERLRQAHQAGMRRYLQTGTRKIPWSAVELPGLHRDGTEVPLEISYGMFRRNGRRYFTGFVRDIAERKQAEKERAYQVMLEQFSREVETLVSERTLSLMGLKLADRVRTPSAVIGLNARKVLDREEVAGKVRERLTAILEEAEKLESIVREFQELVKARKPAFSYEDFNEIVREAADVIRSEARDKGVALTMRLAEGPLRCNAERALLRMAFYMMLRNSLDASSEGGNITVETTAEGDSIALTVTDTGRGIPPEAAERLFDPMSGTPARSGMGLPLIKQIVGEHLGQITVSSQGGRGAAFRVTLPVRWKEREGL